MSHFVERLGGFAGESERAPWITEMRTRTDMETSYTPRSSVVGTHTGFCSPELIEINVPHARISTFVACGSSRTRDFDAPESLHDNSPNAFVSATPIGQWRPPPHTGGLRLIKFSQTSYRLMLEATINGRP